MGLLDKVKAQATQAAQKAQEAGRAGQMKVEEAQAKRKLDSMLRDLGAAVYAERTGKPGADPAAAEILVEQIRGFEAEHAAALASAEKAASTEETGGPGSPPEGGNFNLSDL